MTAVVIPIRDLSTLRRDLRQSVDLLDLAETICNAGSAMNSAGRHLMMLNELPTEMMLSDVEFMAMNVIRLANLMRLASASPVTEG